MQMLDRTHIRMVKLIAKIEITDDLNEKYQKITIAKQ